MPYMPYKPTSGKQIESIATEAEKMGEETKSASGPLLAPQVCYNCKLRKRRCTKELPKCSMCIRLLMKCDYDYGAAVHPASKQKTTTAQVSRPGSSTATQLQASFSSKGHALPVIGFEGDVTGKVLNTLGIDGEDVTSVTTEYFRTVDTWLPIICQDQIELRLEAMVSNWSTELATLLLCMHLTTRTPDAGRNMQDATYMDAKSLVSMQISSGKAAIEIVQACLLLCLYEHCHGMLQVAQITMAACSALGLKMIEAQRKSGNIDIQNTTPGHVWWGVVIIDRYMNLGVPVEDIHLATGWPSQRQFPIDLPLDDEVVSQLPLADLTPSGIRYVQHELRSSAQTTRLGPFCRTAESSSLLGDTLELISGSVHESIIDWNQSQALDHSLQKLAMALLQQAVNGWEECCGAIGICLSTLLLLHKRIWELHNRQGTLVSHEDALRAVMAIRSAVKMVIDISRKFNADIDFINLFALPPPATYCVYLAAMLHIQISGQGFMESEWKSEMEDMKSTLKQFSKRWYIGSQYLEQIDAAIMDELRSRNSNSEAT